MSDAIFFFQIDPDVVHLWIHVCITVERRYTQKKPYIGLRKSMLKHMGLQFGRKSGVGEESESEVKNKKQHPGRAT